MAHENGKYGNYHHTHVSANFKRQFQSRNPRIFDIIYILNPTNAFILIVYGMVISPSHGWKLSIIFVKKINFLICQRFISQILNLNGNNKSETGKLMGWCKEVVSRTILLDAFSLANPPSDIVPIKTVWSENCILLMKSGNLIYCMVYLSSGKSQFMIWLCRKYNKKDFCFPEMVKAQYLAPNIVDASCIFVDMQKQQYNYDYFHQNLGKYKGYKARSSLDFLVIFSNIKPHFEHI